MLPSLLKIQLIDIVTISSSEPRSNFSKGEIDLLAENFLKVGGNSIPLLLKRTDVDSFEVTSGHLEFYAAVRAREINDNFEMINAIVVDQDNESLFTKQYRSSQKKPASETQVNISSNDKKSIATLEKNLLAHLQDTLKFEVSRLESSLSNNLEQKFNGVRILVPNDRDHLKIFNDADFEHLKNKIAEVKFGNSKPEKVAAAILEARKKRAFDSFSDVISRVRLNNGNRAITESSMLKILDSWNGFIDVRQL